MLHRQRREVPAFPQFRDDLLRLRAQGSDLLVGGARIDLQQNVAETVLVGDHLAKERRPHQLVDVLIGDVDAAVDRAPLHALDGEIPADLLANSTVGLALGSQFGNELLDGHLVLAGEVANRHGQRLVVDLDVPPEGFPELNPLPDEGLQDLIPDHLPRHVALASRLHAPDHRHESFGQLAFEHDIVVDDDGDAIDGFRRSSDA